MPYYDFLNEKTGEIKTLFFYMNDDKKFIDESGYQWVRQFYLPQTSFDIKSDPFSSEDFTTKTKLKKGNLGNLFDAAKEASLKREDKLGFDPVKTKFYEDYKNKRKGKCEHPDVKRQKSREKLKKLGITVTD
jgi:hypothetical protein